MQIFMVYVFIFVFEDSVLFKIDKSLTQIKKLHKIHVDDIEILRQEYKAICNYIGIEVK